MSDQQTIDWLRGLAEKGGKGVVNNIDARCLGRIADDLEKLREQLADTKDDYLRRHKDACDKWEALMDIRMIANEPGNRRALIDKIFGIATKALRPITEASRYTSPVGSLPNPETKA